ncbi:hypothetical protein [Mangrovibacterium marinum]|uniref:Uncharacterized protein n=1 Tax=Mangrovibacterium marinum TaxID=1639118 RepID=A0A2T5C664_9BACT|nr:hypothetical protein [Mangrovibacterium marinum]PTN10443.1 hypothetical protein C8N47_10191 [Mangrovibacterium marinum]
MDKKIVRTLLFCVVCLFLFCIFGKEVGRVLKNYEGKKTATEQVDAAKVKE